MHDISATGVKLRIIAIPTFPAGFEVNQFSDDADAISSEDVAITETAVALNGDMVSWSVPNKIPFTINVLPGTDEHKNLDMLWNFNRPAKDKISTHDIITIIRTDANGDIKTFANGKIISGPATSSATSGGRYSTMAYAFDFQDVI